MRDARITIINMKWSCSVCKLPASPRGHLRAGGARLRRRVIILVKAGAPVDSTIDGLVQFMEAGDIIIDGGNEWCAWLPALIYACATIFQSSQQPYQELLKAQLALVACATPSVLTIRRQVV